MGAPRHARLGPPAAPSGPVLRTSRSVRHTSVRQPYLGPVRSRRGACARAEALALVPRCWPDRWPFPLPGWPPAGPANTGGSGTAPAAVAALCTAVGLLPRSRPDDRLLGAGRRPPDWRRSGMVPSSLRMRTLRDPRHTESLHHEHDQCKLRSADCSSLSRHGCYALDELGDARQTGPGFRCRGGAAAGWSSPACRCQSLPAVRRSPWRVSMSLCDQPEVTACPNAGVPPFAAAGSVPSCASTGRPPV